MIESGNGERKRERERERLTYLLDVFIVVAYGSNNHVTVES